MVLETDDDLKKKEKQNLNITFTSLPSRLIHAQE